MKVSVLNLLMKIKELVQVKWQLVKIHQEINQNIDGNYYVLIPADGSTEWMMNFVITLLFKM
jgi:hypothetical protein